MMAALVESSCACRLYNARCSYSLRQITDFFVEMVRVDLSNSSIAAGFCSFGRKISGVGSMAGDCCAVDSGWGAGCEEDAT